MSETSTCVGRWVPRALPSVKVRVDGNPELEAQLAGNAPLERVLPAIAAALRADRAKIVKN